MLGTPLAKEESSGMTLSPVSMPFSLVLEAVNSVIKWENRGRSHIVFTKHSLKKVGNGFYKSPIETLLKYK